MPEEVDKKSLSERDIYTKYITPTLVNRGWDINAQIREEVTLTKRMFEKLRWGKFYANRLTIIRIMAR